MVQHAGQLSLPSVAFLKKGLIRMCQQHTEHLAQTLADLCSTCSFFVQIKSQSTDNLLKHVHISLDIFGRLGPLIRYLIYLYITHLGKTDMTVHKLFFHNTFHVLVHTHTFTVDGSCCQHS